MGQGSTVLQPPPGLRQATRGARCRFIESNSLSAIKGSAALARVLSVIVLCSCIAGFGLAQNTNSGDIRGTVTDPTGAVIPGASVTILNTDTGVVKTLITNQAGLYDAVSILAGPYRLTFSKEGFEKLVRDGVILGVGAPLTVDAQLTVGTAQQQISVTAEATLLKTETGEQSTTLTTQTMTQLPNVGQNWANFMKLIPGASGAPSASQGVANPGTGIAVNGNLPYYANFLADGASTTLPHSANVDVSIFESVSEVQVNTSSFSAQYGIGGAVFNQISKGGTNQWHGSAYEYFQNDALNARSFFDGKTVPRQRYDNFGGSVGGPILKNKLFFYFNIDKIINPNSSTQRVTVPTDAMRNGDFSDPALPKIYDPGTLSGGVRSPFPGNQIPADRFDKVAAALQAYYPHANLPGFSNNYQYLQANVNPFIKEFGRIDYNLSDKNRVTFSITQRDNPAFYANTSCPINCQTGDVDSYNAQASDVWTISPNNINEFRFGYTRQGNWFVPQSLGLGYPQKIGLQYAKADIFPNITINGTGGSNNVLVPQTNAVYIENSFEPSDVVTMIRGRHILHFGGELLAYQDNSTPWGNTQSGQFTFTGVFTQSSPNAPNTGLGYADFLLGQVQKWSANNQPPAAGRQKSPQMFIQDDIKVLPNLTVNIGLRYQIQNGWSEKHDHMGVFDPTVINPRTNTPGAVWFSPNNGRSALEATDYKIILPRVGFAWSPKSDWAVRGGFGIYAYGWSLDTYGAGMGFGSNSTGSVTNSDNLTPVVLLSGSGSNLPYVQASRDPGAYNGQGVSYQPYHTPVARNYQWSFSIQRQLGQGAVAEAAYVGSHGTGLSFPVDINQLPAGSLGLGQSARPYPQFQGLSGNTYRAYSNYDSLQLSVKKRFGRGLSVDMNYTWSKFLDSQDSSGWGSRGGNQYYQSAYNPAANYSLSNFDVPHAFKGAVVYQLPVGRGRAYLNRGGVLDAVIGGWQASTIFVTESGTPFTLLVSGNNGSNSLAGNWYPNLVGDPSVSNQTLARWYNPAAFAQPAANTFGNVGRNILRGPSLTDFDFSLGKNFTFPKFERINLQLRMDASNVLNHPSFNNPNNNIGNPSAGQITSTTVGGRNIQLGARLSF
jgi:hypothetical protein